MAVTDASLIAHEEVGVIFVVSADRTGRRPAQAALDRLEAVGARFVGVVLNRVDLKNEDSPYYLRYDEAYGGTYDDGPPAGPVVPPTVPPAVSPVVSPGPSPDMSTVQPPSAVAGGTEPRA
jgi:hypothetical protein